MTHVSNPFFSQVNNLFSPLEIVVKSIAIFYQGRKQDTSDVALRLTRILQQQGYEVRTIEGSLKDLKHNQNQGLFGGPNGALTFMCLAMAMSRRNDSTVVVNGGGGYHGYYSFRAGW